MNDTPIFDRLARERGYHRLIPGGPTLRLRSSAFQTKRQTDETVNAASCADTEDDVIVFQKPIPVTTLAVLAKGTHQE